MSADGIVRDVSERVAAESALRDSEARYRAVIETAVDGIIGIRSDGRVDAFNRAAELLFGYAAGEVMGENVRMLMPEPDHSRHDGYLRRYLAGGAPRIIGIGRDVTGLRKDGSLFPMHLGVSEFRHGGERRFTAIVRDMSELRRAEEEVARQRDYSAALVASLQDGLVVRTLDGSIAQVNPRFCRMTGFRADELVGASPPFPYWPPGAVDPLQTLAKLHAEDRLEADMLFVRQDGTELTVVITAAPVHDSTGELVMYVETVKDVTERRAAERALASERDYAASIVAGLRDGLLVTSREGAIVEANDAFLEMVGLPRSEVVGATGPPYPWWDSQDDGRTQQLFTDVMRGSSGESELTFRRPAGRPFPVRVSVAPRGGTDEHHPDLVSTYRDMGPWRDAQQELRRGQLANQESEALLVAEREAQRLKDEFLAMVSHELRTPLSAVLGYLELALADVTDEGVREMLVVAERNGRRLSALVTDLLLVARAGAGRLTLDRRAIVLGDLVSHAVVAAQPAASAKGVALEEDLVGNPRINADAARLGQVLDNLISNAVKFSGQGGTVVVRLESDDLRVRLTVEDDGPGVPEEDRPRLFEPFYRAKRTTEEVVPGSGLGLAVVKAITEAHGGRVGVQSVMGRGSVFSAELPLGEEALPVLGASP